jgi:hypothetical protein
VKGGCVAGTPVGQIKYKLASHLYPATKPRHKVPPIVVEFPGYPSAVPVAFDDERKLQLCALSHLEGNGGLRRSLSFKIHPRRSSSF